MKCYDESKIVNLKAEQLSEVSGGSYAYDNYRKYVQLVNKVMTAATEHGYRKACCPQCGWQLEMVTSVARSDDYENRDAAEGILWCHSCGAHTRAENWVINKFN